MLHKNDTATIAAFIERHKITMDARWTTPTPGDLRRWGAGSRHYLCTLKRPGATMAIRFHMGPAHKDPPDIARVLDCLASDAGSIDQCRADADAWLREFGMERTAENIRTFRAVLQQSERLAGFLAPNIEDDTASLYDTLLWETERE